MKTRRMRLPIRRDHVRRPRIERLLDQALGHNLVSVVAGSGYEKSESVAEYVRKAMCRLIWTTVTDHDNDTDHFWKTLVRATLAEFPELSKAWEKLEFPDSGWKYDAFFQTFAQVLYSGEQVLWVVDDFQEITGPEVLRFFSFLIEAGLENFTLLLISGKPTELDLVGLKSLGGLFQITAEDLRYTCGEADFYFRQHGLELPPQEVAALVERSDGWPLLLRLHAMNVHDRRPNELLSGSQTSLVMDLLEKECFAHYSQDMRQLLVRLSQFHKFPLELIKELGDYDVQEAQEMLTQNMFVFYEPASDSYVFQQTYLQFLRTRQLGLSQEERRRVLVLAGQILLRREHYSEALEAFWQSGDHERFLQCFMELPMRRKSKAFANECLDWLNSLPQDFVDSHPSVDFSAGYMLLNNMETHKAKAVFTRLLARLKPDSDDPQVRWMIGELHFVLGKISLLHNTDAFIDHWKQAAVYLTRGSRTSNRETLAVGNNSAFFLTNEQPGELQRMVTAFGELGPLCTLLGNGYGMGYESLFAAEAAYATADLEQAKHHAHLAVFKAQVEEQHDILCNAYYVLMHVAYIQGEMNQVEDYLHKIQQHINGRELTELYELRDCCETWLAIQLEDLEDLPQWTTHSDYAYLMKTPISIGRNCLYYVACLMARREFHEAEFAMRQFEEMFSQKGLWNIRLAFWIMQAVCHMQTGDIPGAVAFFERAYRRAVDNGIVMPFAEFGNLMRTLLRHAQTLRPEAFDPAWMEKVYEWSTLSAKHHAAYIAGKRRSTSPHARQNGIRLSAREHEVLCYLAKGFTREEIAGRLDISVNGVKKHITGVYNKLGAVNRADAIRIATQRGDI